MKEEGVIYYAPTKAAGGAARATAKDKTGETCLAPTRHGQDAHATKETCVVYLNDKAYYKNVPVAVWEYYIGGYQVVKKWLSYRDKSMLGRGLKMEEADYVTQMIRRIAAIVMMGDELDANYKMAKGDTYEWPGVG